MSQNEQLEVGQSVTLTRKLEPEDIAAFARLSQDDNPIHFDDEFAKTTIFERPIAHGMIGASLISGVLTKIMGAGNIWLDANIRFSKPAYVGDTLSATLTIKELDRRGVATLTAIVTNQNDECVVEGQVRSMNFHRRQKKKAS